MIILLNLADRGTVLTPNGAAGITDLASCNAAFGGMGGSCDAIKTDYFDYNAGTQEFSWTGLSGFETSGGAVSIASGYTGNPSLVAVGGGDYPDYAYEVRSSGNTFTNESFANIGNAYYFSSEDENNVVDSMVEARGYDFKMANGGPDSITYAQNTSFSQDRLLIERGTLDVSYNLRARVLSGDSPVEGATVSFAKNDGKEEASLTTDAEGYTTSELFDSYRYTSEGVSEDDNPYTLTATASGRSGSAEVILSEPDMEQAIYLGGSKAHNGYVVTTPASAGGPQVRAFLADGTPISSFMAYDESLRGSFTTLPANLRGLGQDELVTLPGPGFGPELKVFKADGTLLSSTFVYDKSFRGGITATAGDFNGDGLDEIAVAPKSQGGPQEIGRAHV